MNKKCVVLILIISMILSGCGSYRDINNTVFTTVTVIDVDEEGKPAVYMECFMAHYSQLHNGEMGIRTVLVGKGDTVTEAFQRINQTTRQELSIVYSKMIVITKKAAEQGIEDYIDYLVRDQEALLRTYFVIFDGEPAQLLSVETKQGDFIGLYLEQLFQSSTVSNLIQPLKIFDYMNMRTSKSKLAVIAIIGIQEEEAQVDPYIGVKEAAVLKDDKMVDTLTEDEYKTYCLLSGVSKTTLLTVPNPEDEKALVTLIALRASAKKSIEYDGKSGNLIHYKVEVNLTLSLSETQKPLDFQDDKIRKKLEEEVKEKIKKEGEDLFNKYKTKGIDIFKVEEELARTYPQYKMTDVIGSSVIEIEVKTHLEGSPDVQNYN